MTYPFEPPLQLAGMPGVLVRSLDDATGVLRKYVGRRPATRDLILRRLNTASTEQETSEAANNQKGPTLGNEKSSRALAPDQNGRNDSNYQAHQNSKRRAHKHDEHAPTAFHVGHVRQPA